MKRIVFLTVIIAAIAAALACGYYLGRSGRRPSVEASSPAGAEASQQIYTCSMHPQIRLSNPGKCPICEMPLIPAASAQSAAGEAAPILSLSEHALAMANVETTEVTRRALSRDLRAVGKIQYNEPSLATITARVDGYAEKLFVNVTGVEIKAGDHLAEVYSPELLVAQQEMLIAMQSGVTGPLVETTRLKLKRWGLTDKQIGELAAAKTITDRITLYSPIDGTVIEKTIFENSSFKAGDALYRIANLDTVWVYLDIYEYDLAWIRYGQKVELTAEAYPGRTFTGMVTFVEPVVNEATRTIRVPVHAENPDHSLKPGMYVSAVIQAALGADGRAAPTGVEGKYSCRMHPQVLKDAAGACPLCEMPLEQIPGGEADAVPLREGHAAAILHYICPMKCEGEKTYDAPGNCPVCHMKLAEAAPAEKQAGMGLLAVPISAVLDSGTRKIVYVEKERGTFEPREVTTGPRTSEFYPILQGLSEGERVVTRGGFLIDSQFQITGHSSLFYPGGLQAGVDHSHSGTEGAAATPAAETQSSTPQDAVPSAEHTH